MFNGVDGQRCFTSNVAQVRARAHRDYVPKDRSVATSSGEREQATMRIINHDIDRLVLRDLKCAVQGLDKRHCCRVGINFSWSWITDPKDTHESASVTLKNLDFNKYSGLKLVRHDAPSS
jgi:hypothetical protein